MSVEKIKIELLNGIHRHLFVYELQELTKAFVQYKTEEGFPFGILTIDHYHMFGGESPDIVQAAAAVESMILALDIIDDLQDQDQLSVPWRQIEQEKALNIAIGLMTLSSLILEQTSFEQLNIDKLSYIRFFRSDQIYANCSVLSETL